jgi:hypothetical protein
LSALAVDCFEFILNAHFQKLQTGVLKGLGGWLP